MDPVELEFSYREVVDGLVLDHALISDPERELAVVCTTLQEAVEKKTDVRKRNGSADAVVTGPGGPGGLGRRPRGTRQR